MSKFKNPKFSLEYFNDPHKVNASIVPEIDIPYLRPSSYVESVTFDADITIIIQYYTGDQAGLSIFNGIRGHRSAIIIDQDFIFDRYLVIHEVGHVFGCSHQEYASMTKI